MNAPLDSSADVKVAREHPWALLVLLMAATALGPMTLNIFVPAVPGLVQKFSTDAGTVQLIISLYLLGLAVSQLVMGPLSDRFGRRPVLLGGLALTVLSSVAAMLAGSIGALIAARVAQALGASTGIVIGRAIIRDLYGRDEAASMIGWVMTAMVIAPMVAPFLGGVLQTAFGWESIFVFIAVTTAAVLTWSYLALPETRPAHVTGGGARFIARESTALLRSKVFAGYMLAAAFSSATFFSFLGAAPHVVISLMERSPAEYGAWFALSAVGYMAGTFTAANLSSRYGVDRVLWGGLIAELIGAAISILGTTFFFHLGPAAIFIPQVIISFGNGTLLPNAIAGSVSVRPQAAGTASGLTGFTQMTIGAITAQGTGYLVAAMNDAMPLPLTLFFFALAAPLAFGLLVPDSLQKTNKRSISDPGENQLLS